MLNMHLWNWVNNCYQATKQIKSVVNIHFWDWVNNSHQAIKRIQKWCIPFSKMST